MMALLNNALRKRLTCYMAIMIKTRSQANFATRAQVATDTCFYTAKSVACKTNYVEQQTCQNAHGQVRRRKGRNAW